MSVSEWYMQTGYELEFIRQILLVFRTQIKTSTLGPLYTFCAADPCLGAKR
jgi:hypothetical protein